MQQKPVVNPHRHRMDSLGFVHFHTGTQELRVFGTRYEGTLQELDGWRRVMQHSYPGFRMDWHIGLPLMPPCAHSRRPCGQEEPPNTERGLIPG